MSAIDRLIKQIAEETATGKKEEYIQAITELLMQCNDIPLLDLIQKLLTKSV